MLLLLSTAAAATWAPLRLAVECQSERRVEACTFVRGTLEGLSVVAIVPRSEAQVTLHLNATSEGTTDFVQLRAVSDVEHGVPGAPASYEQVVAVDYRTGVDEQRAVLDPALRRALAPFLAQAVPGSVTVALAEPPGEKSTAIETSPWGTIAWAGGWGSWSADYRSLSLWTGAAIYRKTDGSTASLWINYDRSVEQQPSLVVDSTEVALTSDTSSVTGAFTGGWNLDEHWTLGGQARGGHDDPEGQYLGTGRAHLGVEYNHFASADPRGNVLALGVLAGAQSDAYNQLNTLGQARATFPTALLVGSGTVRFDTVSLSADLSARAQLVPFFQRSLFSGGVDTSITLGDHVDLELNVEATQQSIPGPSAIDASDYEEVTRASYAQPLELWGHFNVRFHWDNTNSARNNRLEAWEDLGSTDGL